MVSIAYQVSAVNDALTSENRIHSDEIARKYGFTGALVSGVSVFGYLTNPLVAALGEDWFRGSIAEVKFLRPAYEGDLLDIHLQALQGEQSDHYQVIARNPDGVLLAQLDSHRPGTLARLDPLADAASGRSAPTRPEISWDLVEPGVAARRYRFLVDSDRQQRALKLMRDDLALYNQGEKSPVHPYLLLKECNQALMRMFVLPAWIHVGSRLVLREPLTVGEPCEIVTVPIEKWERKGHQFVRLYVAFRSPERVALEVWHTAIFRIAGI
jgi:hypothetical protein